MRRVRHAGCTAISQSRATATSASTIGDALALARRQRAPALRRLFAQVGHRSRQGGVAFGHHEALAGAARLSTSRPSAVSTRQPAGCRRARNCSISSLPAARGERQATRLVAQAVDRGRFGGQALAAACSIGSRSVSPACRRRRAAPRSRGASAPARRARRGTCGKVLAQQLGHRDAPLPRARRAGARRKTFSADDLQQQQGQRADAHRPPVRAHEAGARRRAARARRDAASRGRTGAGSRVERTACSERCAGGITATGVPSQRSACAAAAGVALQRVAVGGSGSAAARAPDRPAGAGWRRRRRGPRSASGCRRAGSASSASAKWPTGGSSGQDSGTSAIDEHLRALEPGELLREPGPVHGGDPGRLPGGGVRRQREVHVLVEQRLLEHAGERRLQPLLRRLGQLMRCQLTSTSASTATTVFAFGSRRAAQRPCAAGARPSLLST